MATKTTNGKMTNGTTTTSKPSRKRLPRDPVTATPITPANDPPSSRTITIPSVDYKWVRLQLTGTGPLLMNKFREEAKQAIEDSQTGKAKVKKGARQPDFEFRESCHLCTGDATEVGFSQAVHGLPVIALKKAVANAAYRYGDAKNIVTIVSVLFIHGPFNGLVPLLDPSRPLSNGAYAPAKPIKRRDAVVLAGAKQGASLAYRPEYNPWMVEVDVRYWDPVITLDNAVNYFLLAGSFVGVGSWRVENKGDHGMFTVSKVLELPEGYVPVHAH